jgi:hypothetical protein
LKEFLGGKQMATDEVRETLMDGLNGLIANFCDDGIVDLVQRVIRCLNHNEDYIEK